MTDPRQQGEKTVIVDDEGELHAQLIRNGERLAIVVHGMASNRNQTLIAAIAAEVSASMSTLRFDMPGSGESPGSFSVAAYALEAHAIERAVQWAALNGFQPYAVIGHSKGANEVILHAGHPLSPSIPHTVAVSGRFDMTRTPPDRYSPEQRAKLAQDGQFEARFGPVTVTVTQAMLDERDAVDMAGAASGIGSRSRVLIVHGSADRIIPVADAAMLCGLVEVGGGDAEVKVVEGADHNYKGMEREVGALIRRWLE